MTAADFSVVVPAHNEELLLGRCVEAIHTAAHIDSASTQVIVVANRCTDSTADIARSHGATVVDSAARNLAAVRNAGAAVATGQVLVTVDADCVMSPFALHEVTRLLAAGQYVGGGTLVQPERRSLGILATYALVELLTLVTGLSGGMFWCRRADFGAIGGFDESRLLAEDLDFARRLRAHGRRNARKLTMQRAAPLVASCRKFDRYGDWHMFRLALELRSIRACANGSDTAWADKYFFDFNDVPATTGDDR